MAKLELYGAQLGDFLIPNKLFSERTGKLQERKLQKYLQENEDVLNDILDPEIPVLWLGREFGERKPGRGVADFFGIDKAGFIVDVELKVGKIEGRRGRIISQIKNHITTYLKWIRNDTFKIMCEEYANRSSNEFRMSFSSLINKPKYGSFDKAYRGRFPKGFKKPRGIKFFIVSPVLIKQFSKGFAALEEKYSNPKFKIYFKWVLIDEPRRGEKTHYCAITTSSKI